MLAGLFGDSVVRAFVSSGLSFDPSLGILFRASSPASWLAPVTLLWSWSFLRSVFFVPLFRRLSSCTRYWSSWTSCQTPLQYSITTITIFSGQFTAAWPSIQTRSLTFFHRCRSWYGQLESKFFKQKPLNFTNCNRAIGQLALGTYLHIAAGEFLFLRAGLWGPRRERLVQIVSIFQHFDTLLPKTKPYLNQKGEEKEKKAQKEIRTCNQASWLLEALPKAIALD